MKSLISIIPLLCIPAMNIGADTRLSIHPEVELSWPTSAGATYQLQWSEAPAGPWTDLGSPFAGDGGTISHVDGAPGGGRSYQVLEMLPGTDPEPALPVNGGFEAASNWTATGNQPPVRSGEEFHGGAFSMRVAIANVGTSPAEAGFNQRIAAQGAAVEAGKTYEFSFWGKLINAGSSYIQQYEVQFLNASNGVIGSSGLNSFNGIKNEWVKISRSGLTAPAGTVDVRILFRFVTGAVAGGNGEIFIDDVVLGTGDSAPALPPVTNTLPVAVKPVAALVWQSVAGTVYQPMKSPDLKQWTDIPPELTGDGSEKSISVPMTGDAEFFRLAMPVAVILPPSNLRSIPSGIPNSIGLAWDASPTTGVSGYRIVFGTTSGNLDQSIEVGNVTTATIPGLLSGQDYFISIIAITPGGESPVGEAVVTAQPDADLGIVALYNASTPLEAETTIHTADALITRVGDRARDRHAREDMFNSYDHYLSWYWEERTIGIEIIDRVAKGGSGITFNYQTLTPLGQPEFRAFFRGINTVAEYHFNLLAPLVGPNLYSATVTNQLPENRPLRTGDRVEIEISQFIQAPANGRSNYYGTTILYIVGQGIVPWEARGPVNDSFPLPEKAWLGGLTTLPYQYSNEPEHRFKQTAGNISPSNIQPFMFGRRLHHTDFGNGSHSESGNPVFSEHAGKLGQKFIARSCVECHVNNGRALPPDIGAPMFHSVVKVGGDAAGTPHPALGSVLQPQSASGPAEGAAVIGSYTYFQGQYDDGSPYQLRKPNYTFQGTAPSHFSVRLTPPLVGLGLLEAIPESAIMSLADPDDSNSDGISGRIQTVIDPESGEPRLGRFTGKSGRARVSHQIASALNTDMGVTSAVFPVLDGEATAGPVELSAAELDEMTRYVSLLGVGARRDLEDAEALQGEQLFTTAGCVKCHAPEMETGPHHPMTELRGQTIRPYTDLLLHDMGAGLADNMGEANASGSEWRTPPLWNIGLTAGVSGGEAYLHDGRARTLEEAILWHGGEADASANAFLGMSAADRAALIKFLKSL